MVAASARAEGIAHGGPGHRGPPRGDGRVSIGAAAPCRCVSSRADRHATNPPTIACGWASPRPPWRVGSEGSPRPGGAAGPAAHPRSGRHRLPAGTQDPSRVPIPRGFRGRLRDRGPAGEGRIRRSARAGSQAPAKASICAAGRNGGSARRNNAARAAAPAPANPHRPSPAGPARRGRRGPGARERTPRRLGYGALPSRRRPRAYLHHPADADQNAHARISGKSNRGGQAAAYAAAARPSSGPNSRSSNGLTPACQAAMDRSPVSGGMSPNCTCNR